MGLLPPLAARAEALWVPSMPEAWRKRTLRAPKGYEWLQPSDVMVGFTWKTNSARTATLVGEISFSSARISPGSNFEEADANRVRIWGGSAHVPKDHWFRGSQTLGKVSLGWVAYVQVSEFWPKGGVYPTEGVGFAYGAASFEEALERAVTEAVTNYRSRTRRPIETLHLEAGIAAKPDYDAYEKAGTLNNYSGLPFFVRAAYPSDKADADWYSYTPPRFPDDPRELVRLLLSPEQRGRVITKPNANSRWWGLGAETYNIPRKDLARPVFTWGIQAAPFRAGSSLSPAERAERDRTFALAVDLERQAATHAPAYKAAYPLMLEAAKLGHPEAQRRLANYYRQGNAVAQDHHEAAAWLKAAADQGDQPAMSSLWEMLIFDDSAGLSDDALALELSERLAAAGELKHFMELAFFHREGRLGLAKDPAKALAWLQRGLEHATARGIDSPELPYLKDEIALAYLKGRGVAPDRARAAQLLRESGAEGSVDALGDIYRAWFYATGEYGYPRDPNKADALLRDRLYVPEDSPYYSDFQAATAAIAAAISPTPAAK